jgi:uncharacterized protein (TIGR02147 family)
MVPAEIPYYIQILKSEHERRNRTGRYSLRTFAKFLDISPSVLSEILRMKKGMAEDTATRISHLFKLRPRERQLFIKSSVLFRVKSKKKKDQVEKIVKELTQKSQSKTCDPADLTHASNLKHSIIIELMSFPDFDGSIEWLSKKLKINMVATLGYLDTLERIKWVRKENDKYFSNIGFVEFSEDQPSENIRSYHKSVLAKATEALDSQNVLKREFQTLTLAFDTDKMPEAKDMIRTFMEQFSEKFCGETKNSVYQLSVNFFNLV